MCGASDLWLGNLNHRKRQTLEAFEMLVVQEYDCDNMGKYGDK